MKRSVVLTVALALLLSASLLFGGGTPSTEKVPEIAVSFPGSVEFFSVERAGMDKAAADLGLKITYADAEWDAGKQLAQVENFAAKGVDLILLCTADNEALIPAVGVCKEAGIPLMTFTNVIGPNPDGRFEGVVSFIGTNEVNIGRLLGKMAEDLLGNQPANIVLIEGTPGTPPQRMRTQGFKEVVAKHPNWQIVYSQGIPGWTKEGALAAMEAFLQTGQKVDLVTTHWHAAASAAALALEEAGYPDKVYVTGLEFSKELVPAIKEGKVDMTSNYSIFDTGYLAVETAAKYLRGEKVPEFVEVDVYIVSKDNVDDIEPEL
jgi:ribose transport system substrate-binding protein